MLPEDHSILDDNKKRVEQQKGRAPQDAVDFIYMSTDENFDTPFKDVEAIQLSSLQARFEVMMEKILPLQKLAQQQGITQIKRLEDAAPLLFGPKVLKSYPIALLENNQFDKLTQWLDRLTTLDLSGIDVSGCDTIDGWLNILEEKTSLMIMHSSGTSGKLSIVPRSRVEMCHFVEMYFKFLIGYRGEYGSDVRLHNGTVPLFLPTYRYGRHIQRPLSIMYPQICGTEEDFICAYPGQLSADFLSLGGRLAAAEAKGQANKVAINPALLEKREELLKFHKQQPELMEAFFERMLDYKGRQVMVAGTWTVNLQATLAAEKRGITNLFAANSFPIVGGGKKGGDFPDDWYERICRFYGMSEIRANYGMCEMLGLQQQCSEGNYHPWPFQIVYLLDVDTGALLPREGTQRGRFGFMDLSAETYWGGGLSGDEVTVQWSKPCACGRQGPYVEPSVVRLSERQGGDDKISCAGAQTAHDHALDVLMSL